MTKRPSQPIHFKDQDQKDRFAQAAIKAGFETGRGPGITAWLKMLGEREIAETDEGTAWARHQAALERVDRELSAPAPVFRRAEPEPETVTWESMTAGERWYFVDEVSIFAIDETVANAAFGWVQNSTETEDEGEAAMSAFHDASTPGYQARYNAALAYVKGVMDGE